jgi:hypothetical protein
MTDRLIRLTTALAVLMVAGVAAVISYQHAYELVISHGETGFTARLLPFTVDGLIWAASMVVLDASRRNHPVPRLALWNPPQGETDHRSSSRVARDLRSPQLSFSGGSARFRGAQEPILDRCAGIDRKLLRLWQTTLL